MSTKSTLASGKNFHLFRECFEHDQSVYLRLEEVEFEATAGSVEVRIPIEIWEVIRHKGGADLDLAGLGDVELRRKVEREVDGRIRALKKGDRFASIAGLIPYGDPKSPKHEQVDRGMSHYAEERERQRGIEKAIRDNGGGGAGA